MKTSAQNILLEQFITGAWIGKGGQGNEEILKDEKVKISIHLHLIYKICEKCEDRVESTKTQNI